MRHGDASLRCSCCAKLTHENFLREYGDAVKGVPLVIYEGRVNRQSKRPFKLAPGN